MPTTNNYNNNNNNRSSGSFSIMPNVDTNSQNISSFKPKIDPTKDEIRELKSLRKSFVHIDVPASIKDQDDDKSNREEDKDEKQEHQKTKKSLSALKNGMMAKKRWNKLKFVVKTTFRRTSLTPSEENLLKALDKKQIEDDKKKEEEKAQPLPTSLPDRRSSAPIVKVSASLSPLSKNKQERRKTTMCTKRTSLQADITTKCCVGKLTDGEAKFLSALIESDNVDDEHIDTVRNVLLNDPIFEDDEDEEEQEDEKQQEEKALEMSRHRKQTLLIKPETLIQQEQRPASPTTVVQTRDLSYREELWSEENQKIARKMLIEKIKKERDLEATGAVGGETMSRGSSDIIETFDPTAGTGSSSSIVELLFGNVCGVCILDSAGNSVSGVMEDDDLDDTDGDGSDVELYPIIGTSGTDKECFPHVLTPPLMDALRQHLPYVIREDNYWLKYSMLRDGSSMRILLKKIRNSTRTIIAIETTSGDVFGSFTSSPWRPHGRTYYGSGEAFLWRQVRNNNSNKSGTIKEQIKNEFNIQVYDWSRQNRNIQSLANMNSQLIIGGGGPDMNRYDPYGETKYDAAEDECQVGLIVESTLEQGTTNNCLTFKSPSLTLNSPSTRNSIKDNSVFDIANIEVWTLTPVDNVDQAEKLEYGRQFVFDHGNYAGAKLSAH